MSDDDWHATPSGARESLEARLAAFLAREAAWDPDEVAEILGEEELGSDADMSTLAELRGLADSFEFHGTMAQGDRAEGTGPDTAEAFGGLDIESALREHLPQSASTGSHHQNAIKQRPRPQPAAPTARKGRPWQVLAAAAAIAAMLGAGYWATRTSEPDFSRHSGTMGDPSEAGGVTLERPVDGSPRLLVDLPEAHLMHHGELRAEVWGLDADRDSPALFTGKIEGTTHVFSAADAAKFQGPLRWRAWIELVGDTEPRWEARGESPR